MRTPIRHASILLLSTTLGLLSCEKDDDGGGVPETLSTVVVNDLPADTIIGIASTGQPFGAGRYTLFSMERNTVVPNTDSASAKWDVGFRGTTVITNSGNSGPAQGGAFVFTGLFDELKTIPADSVFRTDNAPSAYAVPFGSNRGWYVYNAPANLVTPIPGRVLVFRTASGRFAKMEILNYYKGGMTPATTAPDDDKLRKQRFYKFRNVFQPNGGKTF